MCLDHPVYVNVSSSSNIDPNHLNQIKFERALIQNLR